MTLSIQRFPIRCLALLLQKKHLVGALPPPLNLLLHPRFLDLQPHNLQAVDGELPVLSGDSLHLVEPTHEFEVAGAAHLDEGLEDLVRGQVELLLLLIHLL